MQKEFITQMLGIKEKNILKYITWK